MANRYWVGGTATWDNTAGTKWATTSGGTGGASAPTTADDVFFNGSSGTGTVTTGTGQACLSVNFTGFTGTITGTSLAVSGGSFTMGAGTTIGATLFVSIACPQTGTATINTNGKTLPNGLTITAISPNNGGQVNLGAAATVTGAFVLSSETRFNLNGFDLTATSFNTSGGSPNALTFGSNRINLSGNNITVFDQNYNLPNTFSGAGGFYATYTGATGTRTFSAGTTGSISTNGSAPLYITGGTDRINFTGGSNLFRVGVVFTGFSGTLGLASATGSLSLGCTWNPTVFVNTFTIEATSTRVYTIDGQVSGTTPSSQYIRLGVATLTSNYTNAFTGTYQAITSGSQITLGGFILTVDNLVLTDSFSSILISGPGTVRITGNNKTVFQINTTGSTSSNRITNSPVFELTYSGSVGTRTVNGVGSDNLNGQYMALSITAGSDIVNFSSFESYLGNFNLTGFSGTISGNVSVAQRLTISNTTSFDSTTSNVTFRSATGSTQITAELATVGGNCRCPRNLALQWTTSSTTNNSTLTLVNSVVLLDNAAFTADFRLVAGTLVLNGFDLSVPNFNFPSNNTFRGINFGLSGTNKIIINSRGIRLFDLTNSQVVTYITFTSANTNTSNNFEISGSSGQTRLLLGTTTPSSTGDYLSLSRNISVSITSTSDNVTLYTGQWYAISTSNTFSGTFSIDPSSGYPIVSSSFSLGTTGATAGSTGAGIYFHARNCTLSSGITMLFGVNTNVPNSTLQGGVTLNSNVTINQQHSGSFGVTVQNTGNTLGNTLNLSSFTLNTDSLNFIGTSSSAPISINFGTGTLNITGNARTVLTDSGVTLAPLSFSGTTQRFNFTYSGSVGTRTINYFRGASFTAPSFRISAGSDTVSCTNASQNASNGINFTGFTGTFTTVTGFLSYSDVVLGAGMTCSSAIGLNPQSGTIRTVTSNGVTIASNFSIGLFSASSTEPGTVRLVDSLNVSLGIFFRASTTSPGLTFDTNNQTVTCRYFEAVTGNGATTSRRNLILGTSTININANTSNTTVWNIGVLREPTLFSFSGASSTINVNLPNSAGTDWFFGDDSSGLSLITVAYGALNISNSAGANDFNSFNICNANSFTSLSLPTKGTTGVSRITFSNTSTTSIPVSGNINFNGSATSTRRMIFTPGRAPGVLTISAATVSNLSNIDFANITASGASTPWAGTNLGNGGNNTNITFVAGGNRYYVAAAGGNYTANAWATSSGGTVSTANYPLPQDTVFFDDNSGSAGSSITFDSPTLLPAITTANRTTTLTLVPGSSRAFFCGNLTLSSVVTIDFDNLTTFAGNTTFTPNSATYNGSFTINNGGLLTAGSNLTFTFGTLTVTGGRLSLNNNTLTVPAFNANSYGAGEISFGSSGVLQLTNAGTIYNTFQTGPFYALTGSKSLSLTNTGTKGIVSAYIADGTTGRFFGTESMSPNIDSVATSGNLEVAGFIGNLNLSSFTSTVSSFSGFNSTRFVGDVTIGTGTTLGAQFGDINFAKSSGVQTFNPGGKTFSTMNIGLSTPTNGVLRLLGNFSCTGSTGIQLNAGEFDLNGFTATTPVLSLGVSSFNIPNIKLNIGTSTLNLTGNNVTVLELASTTQTLSNVSVVSPSFGTVNLNGTGTKTINPRGANLNGLSIVNNNASGSISFSSGGTYSKIVNNFSPATFTFNAGSTHAFTDAININGTSGNLVVFQSSSNGNRYTISSGVSLQLVTFTNIRDSDAVGGSYFSALTTNGNIDGGNNLGWTFSAAGDVYVNLTGETITTAVGIAVFPDIDVSVSGVDASTAVGDVTPFFPDISVNVTGEAAFGVTFQVDVAISIDANVTGLSATTAVGDVTPFFPDIRVSLEGVESVGQIGENILFSLGCTFPVSGVTAVGEVGTLYFWQNINDSQTANWVSVTDAQSPNWGAISNPSSTTWTPI